MSYKTSLKQKYGTLIGKIKSNKTKILLFVAAIFAAFIIFRPLLVVFGFIMLAIASRLGEMIFKESDLGIELMTFATVICSIQYSPFVGALAGVSSLTISVFLNQENPKFLPISWAGLVSIAYFSAWLSSTFGAGIVSTGIASSLAYNLLVGPLFVLMLDSRITAVLFFSATNLAFNYFVFANFAAKMLAILS